MVKYAHEGFVSAAESAEDAERDANERAERDYWDCRRRGNKDAQGVCPPHSFSASSAFSVRGRKKGRTTMVVRIGSMYSGDYQLHDGQLCAIVDGEFVPCEDDDEFECYLRRRDGEGV